MIDVKINGITYVPKQTYVACQAIPLGQALRSFRRDTLNDVSRAVGISKTYLWELEAGEAESPSFAIVAKLARHYGVSLDELAKSVEMP